MTDRDQLLRERNAWREQAEKLDAEIERLTGMVAAQDRTLAIGDELAESLSATLAEERAKIDRLQNQITEIPTLCRRYEAEIERMRELLWRWMSTQEGDDPVTPELMEETDAALAGKEDGE